MMLLRQVDGETPKNCVVGDRRAPMIPSCRWYVRVACMLKVTSGDSGSLFAGSDSLVWRRGAVHLA